MYSFLTETASLTKFLKKVKYENFLYKGCLGKMGEVKIKRVGFKPTEYNGGATSKKQHYYLCVGTSAVTV